MPPQIERSTTRFWVDADCIGIQPEELEEYWATFYPFIEKALFMADWPEREEEVFKNISEGKQQLFGIYRGGRPVAAVVTQIYQQNERKTGCLLYVGGEEMFSWVNYLAAWAEWFKQEGCQYIEANGRVGWKKFLEPHGLKPVTTTYRAEL